MSAVLEGLRGKRSIGDNCRKYRISESLYYCSRDDSRQAGAKP
jgi:hypothetical protein